jgi:hypothetical protein
MCLSHAYSLDPNHPETKEELRTAVHTLLKQEPFLAYVYETEQFYQVRSGRDLLINIPKNRTFETPYLKKAPGLAQPAFRWLSFAVLALFLGGVGAVFFAPCSLSPHSSRQRMETNALIDRVHSGCDHLAGSHPISWLLLIRYPS